MNIITLTGPTASGKSTIADRLLEVDNKLFNSISTTTRKIRKDEVDGKDYNFVSFQEFETRVKNNEFLEHARFCLLYTSPSPRDATLSRMPSSA